MDEARLVRDALADSLEDVEPRPFRRDLQRTAEGRPLTPGVLTIRTARAVDPTVSLDAAAYHAMGVQLGYLGLREARRLIETEPWPPAGDDDPDVDVVASEVLVAKGLNHLAHTGVRDRVVEIVRRFGRSQSRDADTGEPSLEAEFVVLAIATGADLTAQTVPPGLIEYARELAGQIDEDPIPAGAAIDDVADNVERIVAASESPTEDRSQSSTMDH